MSRAFRCAEDGAGVVERARGSDLHAEPPHRLSSASAVASASSMRRTTRSWKLRASCSGLGDVVGDQRGADLLGDRLGLAGQKVAADPLPDRIERDARDPAAMLVDRRRHRPGRVRAAGRTAAPDCRRAATGGRPRGSRGAIPASTSSAPGMSSPRSRPRSSSVTSIARELGLSSRRYCRNRSMGCPEMVIPRTTRDTTTGGLDTSGGLKNSLKCRINQEDRRISQPPEAVIAES